MNYYYKSYTGTETAIAVDKERTFTRNDSFH